MNSLEPMPSGEISALHYLTGQPIRLSWDQGRITAIHPGQKIDTPDQWLAPGLFDLQINGFAGIDFQQDNVSIDQLLRASAELRAAGCCRFLLTLITDDWTRMLARLEHLRHLRDQSPHLQQSMAGWHIEGPFLSAAPGFAGAHDAACMCDPTPKHLHALRAATGQDPLLLTLAPERPNAIAMIALAVSLGFRVSLGHTNASADCLLEAVRAGASGFTHLGNGCPAQLDRHDNIIWRVFDSRGLTVSLIPDGLHVPPPLFRVMHRNLSEIYYTSDAMAAAGAPPGRYRLGRLELEVGQDRIVRRPGSDLFAGAGLDPLSVVLRAAEMLDCPWAQAWARLSEVPARFMGFPAPLTLGQPANLCLLQVTAPRQLKVMKVVTGH